MGAAILAGTWFERELKSWPHLNFGDSRQTMTTSEFDLLLCKTESTIESPLRKEMGGQREKVE